MNPSTIPPAANTAVDEDLAEQARPGHGIPSQDPDPDAQIALEPEEVEREANSVMAGGGMVGGAAVGATVGVVVAGPVGAVVGGALGAFAGVLSGAAAGVMIDAGTLINTEPSPEERTSSSIRHNAGL